MALLLSLVMVLAMSVVAFATEPSSPATSGTYTITINNSKTGHTYEAYQIFTGTLSDDTLSDIQWGNGVNTTGQTQLGNASIKAATLTTEALAAAFAKDVAPYLQNANESNYDNGAYTISGLQAGYYLVKDKDGSVTGEGDAYTEYIVKVVGNVTTEPKSDVSRVEKKVKDTNDSTGETSGWQDSADYDIGDSVPFQLKATLADNVSSYTTYKVVFHDTLSKGLTYNNDAKVYIDGEETNGFTVAPIVNADGTTTLTVSCDDVKALGAGNNSVITVEYTAALNGNAVAGTAGNNNKVYLEYSNNPNKSEKGDNETGNTPEDTVVVFTYKTIINKVDGQGNSLTGAEFTLEKYNNETSAWEAKQVVKNDEGTTFTFSGLDDGKYRLTETKTPAGYNTIDPIEFTISATHSETAAEPELSDLSGASIVEGKISFTKNLQEGSLSANVVNKAGSILPSTGGMGTTLLYIIGAILVVGAGVLLVARRRMHS